MQLRPKYLCCHWTESLHVSVMELKHQQTLKTSVSAARAKTSSAETTTILHNRKLFVLKVLLFVLMVWGWRVVAGLNVAAPCCRKSIYPPLVVQSKKCILHDKMGEKLKQTQTQSFVTDRGQTLIIQVSKSVFKYGIKINAGQNNKELCSTLDRRQLFFLQNFECDFTSAMATACANYCSAIK